MELNEVNARLQSALTVLITRNDDFDSEFERFIESFPLRQSENVTLEDLATFYREAISAFSEVAAALREANEWGERATNRLTTLRNSEGDANEQS
jgi:hypothetical protein